ncbi:MAG: DNA/RNA non-specific endonuclease, partial [Opitutales bacterium]|nr:DNA/RNA non-specific endonuclease [Opitutales bacterium]
YSKSGYDRGHMAPNYAVGRCYGPEAQSETFYMTNIIPQTPKLNRQTWRELEMRIANDIARKYETARVFVGPILSAPTRFMKNKIAVPVSCYAAIVVCDKANGRLYGLGFIIPQNPAENSIWDYCVAIDEIEELTGIDFFHQLPDDIENEIEANADPSAFKD